MKKKGKIFVLGSIIVFFWGCQPKYPKCNKDEDCRKDEYCVNGLCQQCRDDNDCAQGEICEKGRCEKKEGYCTTNEDCEEWEVCKNNICSPCETSDECGVGKHCQKGRCIEKKEPECTSDIDCQEGKRCIDGVCISVISPEDKEPECLLKSVYFDFDSYALKPEGREVLQENAICLQKHYHRQVILEGHCDPRGTEEYNLALGEHRAQAVKKYLVNLGIPEHKLSTLSRGELDAQGTNEEEWAKDRKVVFK
jgi:peptidoglycan-associated lipoprotein